MAKEILSVMRLPGGKFEVKTLTNSGKVKTKYSNKKPGK